MINTETETNINIETVISFSHRKWKKKAQYNFYITAITVKYKHIAYGENMLKNNNDYSKTEGLFLCHKSNFFTKRNSFHPLTSFSSSLLVTTLFSHWFYIPIEIAQGLIKFSFGHSLKIGYLHQVVEPHLFLQMRKWVQRNQVLVAIPQHFPHLHQNH